MAERLHGKAFVLPYSYCSMQLQYSYYMPMYCLFIKTIIIAIYVYRAHSIVAFAIHGACCIHICLFGPGF